MNTYKVYSTNNPVTTAKNIEANSNQEALDKYCQLYGLVDYADFVKWTSLIMVAPIPEIVIEKV